MADTPVPLTNGINQAAADYDLPDGFMVAMRNFVYRPDDPSRPYIVKGRTLTGAFPTGQATATDLAFMQYETVNKDLLLANNKLYESTAVNSGRVAGDWTTAKDAQGSPVDFTRTGSFLKAIHDGTNRWVAWSGVESERPLVRDSDGTWRYLGLKKPAAPTLAKDTTALTTARPNSATSPVGGGFTSTNLAYDADTATRSTGTLSAPGTKGQSWEWAAGAIPAGPTLYVKLGTSSLPIDGGGGSGGGGSEPLVATLKVEYSENNGGAYTTMFEQNAPVSVQTVSKAITGGGNFSDLIVRVTLTYDSGTTIVYAYIYEIYVSTGGGYTAATESFSYVVTEVYKKTLGDGTSIFVESAPSDVATVNITSGDGTTNIRVTLPTQVNTTVDGVSTSLLTRRIYRTVGNGAYPNLGLITEVGITDTVYVDNFAVSSITLGSPTINVTEISGVTYPTAGQPPAFQDATLYKGAMVAIPYSDPYRINWSAIGQPDYWPAIQDLILSSSDRNDKLKGIVAVGPSANNFLLFMSTRVIRVENLPFISGSTTFDLTGLSQTTLSPSAGLATNTPHGYCVLQSQKGHPLVAWIAHNGIWMTDGSLVSERGMGIVKLSVFLKWDEQVDPDNLGSARLTYDPNTQIVWFDFVSLKTGNRESLALHFAPNHWVASGQDQSVPKITGPHPHRFAARSVGEISGRLRHRALIGSGSNAGVYLEESGQSDAASLDGTTKIRAYLETPWRYGSPGNSYLRYKHLMVYHSDWGPHAQTQVEMALRNDPSGIIQRVSKSGSLAGSRATRYRIDRRAISTKVSLTYEGNAAGAIGPMVLESAPAGQLTRD